MYWCLVLKTWKLETILSKIKKNNFVHVKPLPILSI